MRVFAVIGQSKTGKTRLIKELVLELKKRGHSVAVVKHCAKGFDLDPEGKDSWQFLESGSDGVAVVSQDRLAVFKKKSAGKGFSEIATEFFKNVDFVFIEGGSKDKKLRKIEVLRKGITENVECSLEELAAVVSDVEVAVDKPVFHHGQIGEISNFIESSIQYEGPRVYLEIDGKPVRLNAFVKKNTENIILGMIKSLDGLPENPECLTLSIIRKEKKNEKI
ncbi:MAG: molybdopterin-guanine dinucleotide biosynthesis protein B [Acidobacteriota bacterium]|nr:molybdopterin-guanine dinucleotide biosynthesis protein B [Acidobacteriota bacterium]